MQYAIFFSVLYRSGIKHQFTCQDRYSTQAEAQEMIDENNMSFLETMSSVNVFEGVKIDNRIIQMRDVSEIEQIVKTVS